MKKPIKVLINAYACGPHQGSEDGMAWNWCVYLAKHSELFIITEGEHQEAIEKEVTLLPQGPNMHFYFNSVSNKVRKLSKNQGNWRFYWYYRRWQHRTLKIATQICNDHQIDIIHHLNMIGFREPGLLWKIKGPKYVWGPIGGYGLIPFAYLKDAGFCQQFFFVIKNCLNKMQARCMPNIHKAFKRADVLIAASSENMRWLQSMTNKQVFLINETGCHVHIIRSPQAIDHNVFRILWVGKLDFRKQLHIALRVIGGLKEKDVFMHICGSGLKSQITKMKKTCYDLGISNKINYEGEVTHEEVQNYMRKSDLLLFTSISEGTPHAVMEAITNGLPVVCFDTCGQGDVVNDKIGRKIPLTNPEDSVVKFVKEIKCLYDNRALLNNLSNNCLQERRLLSWDSKANEMMGLYLSLLHINDENHNS